MWQCMNQIPVNYGTECNVRAVLLFRVIFAQVIPVDVAVLVHVRHTFDKDYAKNMLMIDIARCIPITVKRVTS